MLTAETIDRIARFDGRDLPVISLYVGVDAYPGHRADLRLRVASLLDQIRPLVSDASLGREYRMSVRADIERVRELLGEERWKPGAAALFACSGRDLLEEVPLPRPVRDRIMVDTTPYLRPLLAVLGEYQRSCVVVIDKASARLWEIYQDEMRELPPVRDEVLRKPNYAAGHAEDRVRNKAGELSKRHYRHVGQLLDEMFRTGGYDLLILAGHDYEVPAFTEFLPRDLRARVAGTFTIDPTSAPLAEIRRQAAAIAARYEQAAQRRLVSDVLSKVAAGGLAAAGLRACLWAGSVAATQTLLVPEGVTAPGVVCQRSDWLAQAGDSCPVCGSPVRRTPDVIDELAQAVIDEGGSVRHVADDARLREHTVAAALRFPLPPPPDRAT